MTDDIKKLIEEARDYAGVDEYGGATLLREMADALEAEHQRAEEWQAAHQIAFDREADMAVRLGLLANEHEKAGKSWDRTRKRLEGERDALRTAIRDALASFEPPSSAVNINRVIVDKYGDAWQKSGYLGYWYRAFDGDGLDSFALAQRAHPVKLVRPTDIATGVRRCTGCGEEHECPTGTTNEGKETK